MIQNNKEKARFFTRLKNMFFSLYEVEQELSLVEKSKKLVISGTEHDYIASLKMRRLELKQNITNLIHEDRNKES